MVWMCVSVECCGVECDCVWCGVLRDMCVCGVLRDSVVCVVWSVEGRVCGVEC